MEGLANDASSATQKGSVLLTDVDITNNTSLHYAALKDVATAVVTKVCARVARMLHPPPCFSLLPCSDCVYGLGAARP